MLSAKETKLTSLEVRTHPTILETYDFGPVELPGLLRNGPMLREVFLWVNSVFPSSQIPTFDLIYFDCG